MLMLGCKGVKGTFSLKECHGLGHTRANKKYLSIFCSSKLAKILHFPNFGGSHITLAFVDKNLSDWFIR